MSKAVVVGAGLGGLLAANILASKGIKVTLLYKGLGATTLSSGRLSILDKKVMARRKTLKEKYQELAKDHPYKVLSKNSYLKFLDLLNKAKRELEKSIGNMFVGEIKKSKAVIHQSGTLLEATQVMKTMKGAIVEKGLDEILLLGIEGLYEFNPNLVKSILEKNLTRIGLQDIEIITDYIKRKKIRDDSSPILGETIIDEEKLMKEILKKQEECMCRVLYPPILQYNKSLYIHQETKGEASEVTAEPKFAVGKRILEKLIERAMKNEVELKHIEDIEVDLVEKETIKVKYLSLTKTEKLNAEALILATGDLVGGGIRAERKNEEIIYLDTTTKKVIEKKKVDPTKANYFSKETTQILNSGYTINENSQPTKNSREIHQKLYVAGAIIGKTSLEEGVGLGLPLISAYKATKHILENW